MSLEGATSTRTDALGRFQFRDVPSDTDLHLRIQAPGAAFPTDHADPFAPAFLTVTPKPRRIVPVVARLMSACRASFHPSEAVTLDLRNCGLGSGIRLSLSPNAVRGPSIVEVEMASSTLEGTTAGALPTQANDPLDPRQIMGGFHVSLRDALSGAPLALEPNAYATISIPNGSNTSPASLHWDWYDESKFTWVQGGPARLSDEGRRIELQTPHFTFFRIYGPSLPPAAFGCLRFLGGVLEPESAYCQSNADCPLGPDGRPQICRPDQGCGCSSNDQCLIGETCQAGRCNLRPDCTQQDCGDARDGTGLVCAVDTEGFGRCTCNHDAQCPADQLCVRGECVQGSISVDVYANNHYFRTLPGAYGDCWRVPAGDIDVTARYVNAFSTLVTGGQMTSYSWESPPTHPISVPASWSDQCASEGCAEIGGRALRLKAEGRSCVTGRVFTECGANCEEPLEGLVQVRRDGVTESAGLAQSDGRFCAPVLLGDDRSMELTHGTYPAQAFRYGFTATGGRGASCDSGGCQDLGQVLMPCPDGDCIDARFTVEVTDGSFRVDASRSKGPIAHYEFELYRGPRLEGPLVAASPTLSNPLYVFREIHTPEGEVAITPGVYSILLRAKNDRLFELDTATHVLSHQLEDRVDIFDARDPSQLWGPVPFLFGCTSGDQREGFCLSDYRLPNGELTESVVRTAVPRFQIDRHEVRQDEYDTCIRAGACSAPEGCLSTWSPSTRADHPVACVTWAQAAEYCAWKGGHLPTELQWGAASRGSLEAQRRAADFGETRS